jgi:hypothetical protein
VPGTGLFCRATDRITGHGPFVQLYSSGAEERQQRRRRERAVCVGWVAGGRAARVGSVGVVTRAGPNAPTHAHGTHVATGARLSSPVGPRANAAPRLHRFQCEEGAASAEEGNGWWWWWRRDANANVLVRDPVHGDADTWPGGAHHPPRRTAPRPAAAACLTRRAVPCRRHLLSHSAFYYRPPLYVVTTSGFIGLRSCARALDDVTRTPPGPARAAPTMRLGWGIRSWRG